MAPTHLMWKGNVTFCKREIATVRIKNTLLFTPLWNLVSHLNTFACCGCM